ncbi:MAG: hypothetical protein ACD_17C00265G0001 [uncultured bacterium]|nr:MAG: hypothetical protein ACD_17C00265G0001 [uncultured bacterium]OGN56269.1 MAG: hypothetical protein A2796_05045 [Chlamydiae bacterium RIFCSPHIGHO2_01_FULL_44_39]OGN57718.1 MAG: hypothetical protein A3C42_06860 [Chlamydiae bacterium RIFCSPHIGHO2_02_FULL_45_9]OGN60741.1 MAG: hypothetical protein A3D96_02355 [Chlamydiae bacterium RIFCSPHIGHO2_12_FULL_44_59]OGN67002.1 MAG: hypothetical protein A2978_02585 [Chlamydiae bacterium RIFCSPLOWO2_01_FULL_44_52]OGN67554.1 MAG: hypothetical protein A3
MKKFTIYLTAAALLASNGAYAQTQGNGAAAGSYSASNFAWGIGLAALVVIGVVVGITAGAAASNSSSVSH